MTETYDTLDPQYYSQLVTRIQSEKEFPRDSTKHEVCETTDLTKTNNIDLYAQLQSKSVQDRKRCWSCTKRQDREFEEQKEWLQNFQILLFIVICYLIVSLVLLTVYGTLISQQQKEIDNLSEKWKSVLKPNANASVPAYVSILEARNVELNDEVDLLMPLLETLNLNLTNINKSNEDVLNMCYTKQQTTKTEVNSLQETVHQIKYRLNILKNYVKNNHQK